MITTKLYQCPVCKDISKHSTNHYGEIYDSCKKCGSMVLYCIDKNTPEDDRPKNRAELFYYRYDVSNTEQSVNYKIMCRMLEHMKYKKFDVYVNPMSKFLKVLGDRCTEGKLAVVITDKDQFDDQFVTDAGRLHNWFEAIYPNKSIKEGYYLKHQ